MSQHAPVQALGVPKPACPHRRFLLRLLATSACRDALCSIAIHKATDGCPGILIRPIGAVDRASIASNTGYGYRSRGCWIIYTQTLILCIGMTFVVPCGSINIDRVVVLRRAAVTETPWGTSLGQSMLLA
jgi:hypothetical protein